MSNRTTIEFIASWCYCDVDYNDTVFVIEAEGDNYKAVSAKLRNALSALLAKHGCIRLANFPEITHVSVKVSHDPTPEFLGDQKWNTEVHSVELPTWYLADSDEEQEEAEETRKEAEHAAIMEEDAEPKETIRGYQLNWKVGKKPYHRNVVTKCRYNDRSSEIDRKLREKIVEAIEESGCAVVEDELAASLAFDVVVCHTHIDGAAVRYPQEWVVPVEFKVPPPTEDRYNELLDSICHAGLPGDFRRYVRRIAKRYLAIGYDHRETLLYIRQSARQLEAIDKQCLDRIENP